MSNRDTILDLISRDPVVRIGRSKLTLTRPTKDQIAGAAAFSADTYPERNQPGLSEEAAEAAAAAVPVDENTRRAISLAERCVMVCLPELQTPEEAFQLIQAGGGLMGDLAQTCMSLCGLGGGLQEAAEADPTPS